MPIELEPRGREIAEVPRAAVHFEDFSTTLAVEVVMVSLARQLLARRFARDLHGLHHARIREKLERPVDGGHADAGDAALGLRENLSRAERDARFADHIADRLPLPGLSLLRGHEQV